MPKTMISTVRLDEDTYASLLALAKTEGVHPDLVAARLLTAAVYDKEDQ